MSDDSTLRQKAREAIRDGKLPSRCPERTWGGHGTGAHCATCGEPVKPDELEYELEFSPGGDHLGSGERGMEIHHLHIRCFAAWELERKRQDPGPTPGGDSVQRAKVAGDRIRRARVSSHRVLSGKTDDATLTGREPEAARKRGSP